MAQPTKRANINPMDYFSKELTGLIAHITNDIALVLNITEEEADKLKRQYGLALKSYIDKFSV